MRTEERPTAPESGKEKGGVKKGGRKRAFRLAVFAALWLLFLAGGGLALAPTIISTGPGKTLAEGLINRRIAGSVSFESLSLSWRGAQKVRGLTVRDHRGEEVLAIGEMENDRSLLALLLRGTEDLGTTTIDTLSADIVADETGGTNLMSALRSRSAPPGQAKPGFVPVLPFGGLVLGGSRLTVSSPGIERARFDISRLFVELPGRERPLRISLDAATRQGDLSGDLRVEGTVSDLVDREGRLQLPAARADLTVEARHLPVEGIDGALGLGGVLSAALGRELNLTVGTKAALEGITFDMEVRSPNLRADLATALRGEAIVLQAPAAMRFVMTPSLFSALTGRAAARDGAVLERDVPFDISLEGLRVPVLRFDPSATSVQGRLAAAGEMSFSGLQGSGAVRVTSLKASLDAPSLGGKVGVGMRAAFHAAGTAGMAEMSGTVEGLFGAGGRFAAAGASTNLKVLLDRVPTALLERFAGNRGILAEAVGATVNGNLEARTEGAAHTEAHVTVRSERLTADAAFTVGETLTLAGPASVRFRVTPGLLDILAPAGVQISGPAEAELTVSRLHLPLGGVGRKETGPPWRDLQAEAVLAVPAAGVALPALGRFDVEKAGLRVRVATAEQVEFSLAARIHPSAGSGGFVRLTGERPLDLDLGGTTGLDREGRGKKISVEGRIGNDIIRGSAALAVPPSMEKMILTAPFELKWSVPTGLVRSLLGDPSNGYSLAGDVEVGLRIEPFEVPLREFSVEKLNLRGKGSVSAIELTREGADAGALQEMTGDLQFTGRPAMAKFALTANAVLPGREDTHPLAGTVTVANFVSAGNVRWEEAELAVALGSKDFPLAFVGLFTGNASRIVALAGERGDVDGALRLSPLKGGTGEGRVAFRAPRLEFTADLAIGESVTLRGPADFRLTVTPRSYEDLLAGGGGERGGRSLAEETVIEGRVASLRLPRRKEGEGVKAPAIAFATTLRAASWMLRQRDSGETVGLRNLSLTAETDDLSRTLGVRGSAQVAGSEGGVIHAEASLGDMFDSLGKLNIYGSSLKLNVKTEKLPVPLVDSWMGLAGLGEAALGKTLDLTASAELTRGSGPLSLRAEASRGGLDVDGTLREGIFTLSRDLVGRLEVTEDLGTKLLAKVHPFFETVYTSREPLRLEVAKEGFSLPVKGFELKRAVVPRITVGTNRLILRKGGTLEMLISLSQQFGGMKGVGAAGDTELWFTPLVAELRGGVMRYTNRLDLLIDRWLHAISWGTVTMDAGGSSYSLKAGLPAGALRKVLGTDRIGEGEVFVVPLEGREGRIDTKSTFSKAVLDLGRVRGQYELSRKDPLLGLVAGELTKKVIGTETGTIPPPSMSPLPWASLLEPEPEPPTADEPSRPPPAKDKSPEDVIREVLPEDLKGVFDILKPGRK